MQTQRPPVQFDRPPVMEVACGVAFALPVPIKSAHIGLYWSKVQQQYPRCEDAAPIMLVVEGPSTGESPALNLQFEMVNMPELRRAWLINAAGTNLLQLQGDRFIFNWKRTEQDAGYPSYKQVVAEFRAEWAKFKAFLESQSLGTPEPTQLELTYFNMLSDRGLLRDFRRDIAPERFLPEPEAVNFRAQYPLPDGIGRLHIGATTATHVSTKARGIRLELTARGLPKETSVEASDQWFDLAHHWITQGFADITTPEAHQMWGRTA